VPVHRGPAHLAGGPSRSTSANAVPAKVHDDNQGKTDHAPNCPAPAQENPRAPLRPSEPVRGAPQGQKAFLPSGGLLGAPRGRMPGRLRGLDSQPLLALLRGHKGSRLLRPLSRLVDLFSRLAAAQRYQDRREPGVSGATEQKT
jgi:hypothetical protein